MPTTTIDFTTDLLDRAKVAVGKRQNLQDLSDPPVPRDGTGAEVKQTMIRLFKQYVQEFELQEKRNAQTVADFDPT